MSLPLVLALLGCAIWWAFIMGAVMVECEGASRRFDGAGCIVPTIGLALTAIGLALALV